MTQMLHLALTNAHFRSHWPRPVHLTKGTVYSAPFANKTVSNMYGNQNTPLLVHTGMHKHPVHVNSDSCDCARTHSFRVIATFIQNSSVDRVGIQLQSCKRLLASDEPILPWRRLAPNTPGMGASKHWVEAPVDMNGATSPRNPS